MPVGACDRCQHRFVIEEARSLQRTCPRCLHPMRVTTADEATGRAPDAPPAPDPDMTPTAPIGLRRKVPLDRELKYLNGVPLEMTELGQRVLEVLALSACLREEAKERMRELRELRREMAEKRVALRGVRRRGVRVSGRSPDSDPIP